MSAAKHKPETPEIAAEALEDGALRDSMLESQLGELDQSLRKEFGMNPEQTAAGILDLKMGRWAMVRPDDMVYAASLSKIGILLAFFHKHSAAAGDLSTETRHELGLMIKQSSNEMATKFSRELGLVSIQQVLNSYGFYDPAKHGGIWMGKHYGDNSERAGDPLCDHSHAANVRQLLRFYLLLEQGKLVSLEACTRMREIFASPEIPHDPIKFVKGLAGRNVQVLRKWGSWENWLHDSAIVRGENRHYVLVGLTEHAKGDEYLAALASVVDEWMTV